MIELENFINASNIDNDYHKKIFEDGVFESVYTKINLNKFGKIRNQIYWLSLLIYRISFLNYIENINKSFNGKSMEIKKENLLVFHPFSNITSEICKQLKNDFIYPSLISTLCRQMIEQICLIKEIENEKINKEKIVEAALESYNKQLGSKSLNISDLNISNQGLLKVLKNNTSYGKLANKYNYGYMYNFFSGDIHTLSQINKLIPFLSKNDEEFFEIYLNCVKSLLYEILLILNNYNNKIKIDFEKFDLEKIDFIDIKANKKQ